MLDPMMSPSASPVETKLLRLGINGFGRIGRLLARFALAAEDVALVAVNDPRMTPRTAAHLLAHDTVHGAFTLPVVAGEGMLQVAGQAFQLASVTAPEDGPWAGAQVDVVADCSGRFRSAAAWQPVLCRGVGRVVVSAPVDAPDVPNIVVGVNDDAFDPARQPVVSAASCTTNCIAPVLAVLHAAFGIERGAVTTIHAVTNTQRLLDDHHDDLRRARAAFSSLIPTSTGSARTIGRIIPALAGRLNGLAVRVPTVTASLSDLVLQLSRPVTVDGVLGSLRAAAAAPPLRGILEVCDAPLVSSDFVDHTASSIVDAASTQVIDDRLVKVLAWYDNEAGYAARMLDLVRRPRA
jgi:glyceraldehyde 3-phosphate dehydrogenase